MAHDPIIRPNAALEGRYRIGRELFMNRLRMLFCPALLMLGGCATTVSGPYDLQAFNGEPLPLDLVVQVTAFTLYLNENGRCVVEVTMDAGITVPDTEETCSWTADGAVLTVFTRSDDGLATGALSNGTLTLTGENGDVLVFVKR
jgi:hypothetical protein